VVGAEEREGERLTGVKKEEREREREREREKLGASGYYSLCKLTALLLTEVLRARCVFVSA